MGRRAAAAFGLALAALVLICGGVAVDVWMAALPPVETSCGPGCTQNHLSPLVQPWVGFVLVLVGLVMLVVAWRLDRASVARPREVWEPVRSWGAPLLWLVFVPLVAGPATFLLAGSEAYDRSCVVTTGFVGGGGSECPTSVFLPSAVLPGLLNLVPLWWLRRANRRRRIAAIAAGLLGLVGLAASVIVLYSLGPKTYWNFGFLLPSPPPQQAADVGFGIVLWLGALIALLVIAKLPLADPGVSSPLPG